MSKVIKNFIILILILLTIFSIVFGSFLPLIKSQYYITAVKSLSTIKSVADFKNNFDKALKFYSPVGDEEVVKYLANVIFGIISNKNQSEEVSRELVSYIEPYLFENNVRHLISGGSLYFSLWVNYGRKDKDLEKAESYFLKAYQIGPKLPPVLYGLFDLYKESQQKEKAIKIAQEILSYWPEDKKVIEILE